MQSPTDAELVALTLGGDARAFGQLVARYQGSIHGLAYAIVADRSEAEDLAQAAFLRAYLQLAQLRDPEHGRNAGGEATAPSWRDRAGRAFGLRGSRPPDVLSSRRYLTSQTALP